ncbi:hypothetical protein [Phreatobacter cathodiphilus]|uniref:Uncharacterized protein n=1 Tax=Phreatobacter cathodiphilus TaxID=1868589 RepID=A0A2S0N9T8_9HYPH|nr:hypothetical protein [Phreatobacter cathodiphilus]AVO44949.1 hypothetical protein C6569_07670 [Phreatobacter cathodiphilus]
MADQDMANVPGRMIIDMVAAAIESGNREGLAALCDRHNLTAQIPQAAMAILLPFLRGGLSQESAGRLTTLQRRGLEGDRCNCV